MNGTSVVNNKESKKKMPKLSQERPIMNKKRRPKEASRAIYHRRHGRQKTENEVKTGDRCSAQLAKVSYRPYNSVELTASCCCCCLE